MEPIYEKIDETTFKEVKPREPEENTYDLPTLKMNRDNCQKQIDEVNRRRDEEVANIQSHMNDIDSLIQKARDVGVAVVADGK